jgi:hypothetical protein
VPTRNDIHNNNSVALNFVLAVGAAFCHCERSEAISSIILLKVIRLLRCASSQ